MNVRNKTKFSLAFGAVTLLLLIPLTALGQPVIIDVASGSTTPGTIVGVPQGFSWVLSNTHYRLNVPTGATMVAISLTPDNVMSDLAFAIRYNQPCEVSSGSLVYDIVVDDLAFGTEMLVVDQSIQVAQWYIGIVNWESTQESYQLSVTVLGGAATPTPTNPPPPTPTPTTPLQPTATRTPTQPGQPTATPTTPAGGKTWSAGSYQASPGGSFEILLKVDSAQGIAGGECQISFNNAILTAGQALTDTITNGFRIKSNPQSGNIRIAFANATGAGAGTNATLVRIPMTVSAGATAGQTSNLTFSNAALYGENTSAYTLTPQNGSLEVIGTGQATNTPTRTPTAGPATPTPTLPAGTKSLVAGSYNANPGGTFNLILRVNNPQGVAGGECQVSFNSNILTAGQAVTETITNGFRIKSNPQAGNIRIAFANATGAGAGTDAGIVRIPMTVNAGATAGQTSNLAISNAALYGENTTAYQLSPQDGSFQVSQTGQATPTPTRTPTVTPTTTGACPGDANGDNFVNFDDYRSVRDHFGEPSPSAGDANHDGFVNFDDYRSVRDHFGENCGGGKPASSLMSGGVMALEAAPDIAKPQAAQMTLSPSSGNFTSGTFSVEVRVNPTDVTVANVSIFLQFPSSILQFTNGTTNTAVFNNNLITSQPQVKETGIVSFSAGANAALPAQSTLVATLNFNIIGSGAGDLQFLSTSPRKTEASDANFTVVALNTTNGSYQFGSGASDVVLRLAPATGSYPLGNEFDIKVRMDANGNSPANTAVFVQFNPAKIQFISGSTNKTTFNNTLVTSDPALKEAGYISFSAGANAAVTGNDVEVATIRLKALTSGAASVSFSLQNPRKTEVSDANFTVLPLTTQNATYDFTGSAATPTPTRSPTPIVVPTVVNRRADINQDGVVDSKDQLLLHANWHRTNPGGQ